HRPDHGAVRGPADHHRGATAPDEGKMSQVRNSLRRPFGLTASPGKIVIWTLLFLGGVVMVSPFIFMISSSLKTADQIYDLRLIPERPTLVNYVDLFTNSPFL